MKDMAAMIGMAPEEVQALGNLLANQVSTEIDTIVTKVGAQLHGTQWVGTDRQKFESDWTGTYVAQLNNVKQALAAFGQHALQEAQQQIEASAT
jgi:hypothetical protein